MRIYLMRHGLAIERDDPDCPAEAERYLTPKGVQRTRAAAEGLTELGIRPSVLLTSPYVRAVQTGEIVCDALDMDPKSLRASEALKPEAKPVRIAEELSGFTAEEVICFGHAPNLDDFIAYAVRASAPFTALKKAGVACLDVQRFSPAEGRLRWLLSSKQLRALGE